MIWWSDQIIEQTLMKSSKIKGGFTHGRSTNKSVLNKWVYGLLTASNISESLENFYQISFHSGEQHVDARISRIKRDNVDIQKILQWLDCHYPFAFIEKIMSIASGVTGDEKINCHAAYRIGNIAMQKKK